MQVHVLYLAHKSCSYNGDINILIIVSLVAIVFCRGILNHTRSRGIVHRVVIKIRYLSLIDEDKAYEITNLPYFLNY